MEFNKKQNGTVALNKTIVLCVRLICLREVIHNFMQYAVVFKLMTTVTICISDLIRLMIMVLPH